MSVHDELVISEDDFLSDQPSPMQGEPPRQQSVKPRRSFPWKKLGIILGLVVVAMVAFLAFNLLKVSGLPFSFSPMKGEAEGRINILMLGVGDPGHDGQDLADTNLVLSINPRTHQIANISIPRDLRVKIPGHGSGKLNLAATYGVDTSRQTVENTLGIPIHYYVKANFTGLKQVVDAVGGIDIDNPDNLSDPEYPCDNNQYRSCGFKLNAGHYHLNGTIALKYVRCRKGTCGDDFGRAGRQQQVMQAIRAKVTNVGTLANPFKLGKLVTAAGDNIQTDLSVNNISHLNDLTKKVDKSNIIAVVFSLNPDGFLISSSSSSDLLPKDGDFTAIQNFVAHIFTLGPIWAEHPAVVIENGTLVPGIASKFEQKLIDDGYNITVNNVMNALTPDHLTSQVIDYTAGKRPKTTAYLQGLLKTTAIPPSAPVKTPPADIVIILGQDYANSLVPAKATAPSN